MKRTKKRESKRKIKNKVKILILVLILFMSNIPMTNLYSSAENETTIGAMVQHVVCKRTGNQHTVDNRFWKRCGKPFYS